MREPITFKVPGEDATLGGAATRGGALFRSPAPRRGHLKQSVRVGAARAGGGVVAVTAVPGEDVVVLQIANGPELVLHPETARDLLRAQGTAPPRKTGRGSAVAPASDVTVPAQLQWGGLDQAGAGAPTQRGLLGGVVLAAMHVVSNPAADYVVSKLGQLFDGQVNEGVYQLTSDALPSLKGAAKVAAVPAAADGGPTLVLVHGTFCDTKGTFERLWTDHPARVRSLFSHYRNRVYALDHATLCESPIANALTLAKALPEGANLHLVTHSRGGLVAEILARVCSRREDPFTPFRREKLYAAQLGELRELAAEVDRKQLRVGRIVRVACPARGTLLASKRLDAYISVLKWSLELAGIPIVPEFIDFLDSVAQHRTRPDELPGLAAQIPDSPLVQWLHEADGQVDGQLRVVAGDLQADSVTSWLKTLLSDSFFWTDNDLVVQTRSMYGGSPRSGAASFVLDQGGGVSHFNYFTNERTANAIVGALVDDTPQGFRTIGPLSWAGESSTGLRAARPEPANRKAAAERPAVFLLPGIAGSNLKVDGHRVWIGWRLMNGLRRLAYAGEPDGVEPDGSIAGVYDELAAYLDATHEVIDFAFDWRRPIEEEAARLAAAIDAALTIREDSGQPVRLIAHSLGGLVARTMECEQPAVWERMMGRAGARVLMLGTPNAGSWTPMQVLSGDDTFGNTLAIAGAPFGDHAVRQLMAEFPGFIQLQAGLLDEKLGLGSTSTWQQLADDDFERVQQRARWHNLDVQLSLARWGVPPQRVLDSAVRLRKRLDAQLEREVAGFTDKLLLVVGHAAFTPDGYELREDGLVYLDAPQDGDGRVTRQSAMLSGVRTWVVDSPHGSLPSHKAAFEAYRELLADGETKLLTPLAAAPAARGTAAVVAPAVHVASRPSRARAISPPPEDEQDVLARLTPEPIERFATPGAALRISVMNGNLLFVRQPLLLGHYRSTKLTGTERVMDRLIGGAMDASLRMGVYPDAPGSHQVFVNTHVDPDDPTRLPRPEAVIVAGLGEEGKLCAPDLVHAVRQAVVAWSQRVAEHPGSPPFFELAATLLGSGGAGVTVGDAAQAIARGVREANERLDGDDPARKWPRVGHLRLIELYLDRANEAWRALRLQAAALPGHYLISEVVASGPGALPRPLDSGYRGADYDFIRAVVENDPRGGRRIAYTLDTKRARSEVTAHATQRALVSGLVATASNDRNTDAEIGRTLYRLLIPPEMDPLLGGTSEMLLEVDSDTAGIPWELLDTASRTGARDTEPWAVRAKLIRKLRLSDVPLRVADADADSSVLVVGEPAADPARYPPLPGARQEARVVAERFAAVSALGPDKVNLLVAAEDGAAAGPDARTVVTALLARDWRIIHIAGHGDPPEEGNPRGVVLSGGSFLGPHEIRSMRTVPELVFVNCCYLAARDSGELLAADGGRRSTSYDRAQFAASVAEELIAIGVRCVVAAGWAVSDDAASAFAQRFYGELLDGRRFIDAVAAARRDALAKGGNTWGAYQCYGDPNWTLRRAVGDAQQLPTPLADEFAAIASAASLKLALDTLAVKSRDEQAPADAQQDKIRHLEGRFATRWGDSGVIAEAFGGAWAAAGATEKAIGWYKAAIAANDGSASFKAIEELANLEVRRAEEAVNRARRELDKLSQRGAARGNGHRPRGRTASNGRRNATAARSALARAAADARKTIHNAIARLSDFSDLQPTMERESLLGSAYKRLALIEAAAGSPRDEARAIGQMHAHYQKAELLGSHAGIAGFFYPALNRMCAEVVVTSGKRRSVLFDKAAVAAIREDLARRTRDDPDFWSVVGEIELSVYEALGDGRLANVRAQIERSYDDLYARVSAPRKWRSVYDTARFVLPKYARRAPPRERAAAEALLARLQKLAGSTDHAS